MVNLRRNVAYSAAARITSGVVNIVTVIALARLLTPHELGIHGLALSLVVLANRFREFGIGTYLVQAKDVSREDVRATLGLGLLMGGAIVIALALAALPMSRVYDEPGISVLIWILSTNFILVALNQPAIALLTREFRFRDLAAIEISSALVGAATAISLAFAGFGYISPALGLVATTVAYVLVTTPLRPRIAWAPPSFRGLGKIASFGTKFTAAGIVEDLGPSGVNLMLGKILGLSAVAQLGRAQSIETAFKANIYAIVSSVAMPTIARALREGQDVAAPYLKGMAYLTVLAWPFYASAALFADPLVRLLFGEQWLDAIPLLRAVAVGAMIAALWGPLSEAVILMHGRPGLLLRIRLIATASLIALAGAGSLVDLPTAAWGIAAAALITVYFNQRVLTSLIGVRFADIARVCAPSVIVTLVTAGLSFGVARLLTPDGGPATVLALGVAVAALVWLGAVVALGHPMRAELAMLAGTMRSLMRSDRPT